VSQTSFFNTTMSNPPELDLQNSTNLFHLV
jgi:hypothetical protein